MRHARDPSRQRRCLQFPAFPALCRFSDGVPSRSLIRWNGEGADALDEIEAAHAAVGGTAPGRRYATQQINQAYVMLLAARFQAFCRDLHTETVAALVQAAPASYRGVLGGLTIGRKLDQGNPNAGNVGSDFARLGLELWPVVYGLNPRNVARRGLLDEMMEWRNAIAHQDFNKPSLRGRTRIVLSTVRRYRNACGLLATDFDRGVLDHIHVVAGPGAGW